MIFVDLALPGVDDATVARRDFVSFWRCLSGGAVVNCIITHTHTHPFNGPLSRTTRVSRYQKGKTNLEFTEARESEWQWHPLGHMQVCTSLQTDNHASTRPLSVLQAGCPSCRTTNSVKALKAVNCTISSAENDNKVLHRSWRNNMLPPVLATYGGLLVVIIMLLVLLCTGLQCCDAVGWVAGRASGL